MLAHSLAISFGDGVGWGVLAPGSVFLHWTMAILSTPGLLVEK